MESVVENARKLQGAHVYRLTPAEGEAKPCYRCGQQNHNPFQCLYKSSTCCYCSKQGHLKRMYLKRQQSQQLTQQAPSSKNASTGWPPGQSVRNITTDAQEPGSMGLYTIDGKSVKPFTVQVKLNDKPLCMELDTGATVSLISDTTFRELFPSATLQPTTTQLHSYSGETITVMGQMEVKVTHGTQTVTLPLIVVSGNGPNLFGRDWMTKIQ